MKVISEPEGDSVLTARKPAAICATYSIALSPSVARLNWTDKIGTRGRIPYGWPLMDLRNNRDISCFKLHSTGLSESCNYVQVRDKREPSEVSYIVRKCGESMSYAASGNWISNCIAQYDTCPPPTCLSDEP